MNTGTEIVALIVLWGCTACAGPESLFNADEVKVPIEPHLVQVTPDTVDVIPGQGVAFKAALSDQHGNQVNGEIEWFGTGGTIDTIGYYTAGSVRGSFLVVGSHGDIVDTSHVIVTAPSTWVYPGDDIQSVIDGHPPGTEFLLKTGVHRHQSVVLRPNDILTGESGAILSGARTLLDFQQENGYWVAKGQTQENPRHGPNPFGVEVCDSTSPGCIFPEDVFVDNVPLRQVVSIGQLEAGAWYFDYASDEIILFDDPTGHFVETSVTAFAVRGNFAHGARVQNLIIEKYANAAQTGAIQFNNSDRVAVLNNIIRLNHGSGVSVVGRYDSVIGNYIHSQGFQGIGSYAATGLIIEGNEISRNNHAGFSGFWSGGGMKIAASIEVEIRNNHVHHNNNKGIWTDIDNVNVIIEGNLVDGNTQQGIFHEISYDASIRDNIVINNGHSGSWYHRGGIVVASSPNVTVSGNVLRGNAMGIVGSQQDRGEGRYGPYILMNFHVHDNEITMHVGVTGIAAVSSVGEDVFDITSNVFERNTYYLGSAPMYFRWHRADVSETDWQAAGHDQEGTFTRVP